MSQSLWDKDKAEHRGVAEHSTGYGHSGLRAWTLVWLPLTRTRPWTWAGRGSRLQMQKTRGRRTPCGDPRAVGVARARAALEPATRVALAAGRALPD